MYIYVRRVYRKMGFKQYNIITLPFCSAAVGVVALCKLASVSRIKEMCVGAFFKTKHSLDLGYTGIDTRSIQCTYIHVYMMQ